MRRPSRLAALGLVSLLTAAVQAAPPSLSLLDGGACGLRAPTRTQAPVEAADPAGFGSSDTFAGRDGGFTILGDYHLGAGATLQIDADNSLRVGGDVDIAIDDYTRFDLSAATLQLIGLPGSPLLPQDVELLSEDMGNCGITLPDTSVWSINLFRVGPTSTSARLVDNWDNDSRGAADEVLYVGTLRVDAGATLDLNGFTLYYGTLIQTGTITLNGGQLIQLGGGGGPTIDTDPSSQDLCEGQPLVLTVAATGQGTLSYEWRKDGGPLANGGSISGADTDTLTIDPTTAADAGDYDVVVTDLCGTNASAAATVNIQSEPTVNAGGSDSMCEDEGSYTLSGATADNYDSNLWTTDGDGGFDDDQALNPVYTPGAGDIASGSVNLTLSVTAVSPCTTGAEDVFTLNIQALPTADAGADDSICASEGSYTLSGALASNEASVQWTGGDGSFDDDTLLNATYTPGAGDISNGSVELTLTAVANAPCSTDAQDSMILTIEGAPTADVSPDSQVGVEGFSVTFTVAVTGTPPFTYQWKKNTIDIPGATNDSYTIDPVFSEDAGSYTVLVTNNCGTALSDTGTLTVETPSGDLILIPESGSRAPEDCVQPGSGTNETFVVNILMQNANAPVTGGQFFMEYDNSILQFITALPGDPPFTREVFECVDGTGSPVCSGFGVGTLIYATGIENNGTPTTADTVMARLYFTVLQEDCATTSLVTFSDGFGDLPPTRLSGVNDAPVNATLTNLAIVTSDYTAPLISGLVVTGDSVDAGCSATVTFSATVTDNCGIRAADVSVTASLTTGNANFGTPSITITQVSGTEVSIEGEVEVSAVEDCPATVEVVIDATDDCGNEAITASDTADVIDDTAPVISAITITPAGDVDGSCERLVSFSATVTDNCFIDTADVLVVVTPPGNAQMTVLGVTLDQTTGQLVTITGELLISAVEDCPATVQVDIDASDDCGNDATPAQATTDINDSTAPVISAITMNTGSVDAACEFLVEFSATVTDNCFVDTEDVGVTVTLPSANANLGTPEITLEQTDGQTVTITGRVLVSDIQDCPAVVQVDVTASDDCGNAATAALETTAVSDSTAPVITGLAAVGGEVSPACDFTVTFTATVTDNCFVDADVLDVDVAVALLTGNATLGTPSVTLTQTDPQTVTIEGSVSVSDLSSCPATVEVTVNASDDCGNAATTATTTADVTDTTPPDLTVPMNVSVNSDSGTCETLFTTLPLATATDSCGSNMTITYVRDDGKPNLLDPYEYDDSPVTITWTATDNCGNSTSGDQTITISEYNEMLVNIELSPTLEDSNGPFPGATLQRCIRFDLWECPTGINTPSAFQDWVITFPVDAGSPHRAVGASVLIPCGSYNCVTARDRLHTLRSTASTTNTFFSDLGTQYSSSFIGNRNTGGHWLVGGNLNDDRFIDILDFGSFVIRFQTNYSFPIGNTNCSTPFFHADVSGDGRVFTEDFTFIQINFLRAHEPNCCGRPGLDLAPVESISVADLWRSGMGELAGADLNGDGMLDRADMETFMDGAGLDGTINDGEIDDGAVRASDRTIGRQSSLMPRGR